MSIRVALRHRTVYRFDRAVALAPHLVRLRPAPHSRTPIRGYAFNVTPAQHFIHWQQDPFGNWLARLIFPQKTQELIVDVDVIADLAAINPFDFFVEDYAQTFPFHYPDTLAKDLGPYREVAEDSMRLRDWITTIDRRPQAIVDFLVAVNQRVQQETTYTKRMTPGVQSCEVTLARGVGSCRDSAWLLVQVLRKLGLAARFVSGYLVQLRADVIPLGGPPGIADDVVDLHAWTEVYIPGAGWIGLDPTSGLFAAEGHIPLAATPAPAGAAPIEGLTETCEVTFTHYNAVTRILETPRVSRPYSDTQWATILDLGRQVDRVLHAQDVRLALSNRPTFTCLDHTDAPEHRAGATDSPAYQRAQALRLRLRDRYAPAGLLQLNHAVGDDGGSALRWALNLYWLTDNQPMWNDSALSATCDGARGHTVEHAQEFAAALARSLDVDASCVHDAYEDALCATWQTTQGAPESGTALINAIQTQSPSRTPNPDRPVGCALPLKWDGSCHRFVSGPWHFARNRLYLIPGSAPMGLRLPLHLQPWLPCREHAPRSDADSAAPGLPHQVSADDRIPYASDPSPSNTRDTCDLDTFGSPRTAICIQPRSGVLHVFLPPITCLEHFLSLLAHVETVSKRLQRPVVIEGYPPPSDARLQRLALTPAYHGIEVDLPPVANWNDLVATIESLYSDAQEVQLSSETFMLDGRHAGTGGGHAVTLCGTTAADSPFLRRPDLLQSLITYWQHHPALSYFFSGLTVGPQGPAPRFDERCPDQLSELETLFSQPATVDDPVDSRVRSQMLRHVLAGAAGNTRHSEFCIDNLYSSNNASSPQGEVTFRGFEMAPHPRMSALQLLLIRALTVHFWKTPYRKPLADWGAALHDRFMLPHYLWLDLRDVLDDLSRAGLVFERAWFEPFLEFRFPQYGATQINGIELELRAAIEPWSAYHEGVLVEDTARRSGSPVERLQVQVNGALTGRYILTCNGRLVPLHSIGTSEHHVAGVRYRARKPVAATTSASEVHTPLTFDLYDTWNRRSIGGCAYHAAHPGGHEYTTYPINAAEAEARRISRFTEWGHTPPPIPTGSESRISNDPPEEDAAAFTHTLDLCRPVR